MKYRKKPVVIEAVQWDGENPAQVVVLAKDNIRLIEWNEDNSLTIKTLEGGMKADIGDFIIKGVKGELYPCKPDIFEQTYEPVEGEEGK